MSEHEYVGLEREIVGTFKERRDRNGVNLNPSPLDGLHYCAADLIDLTGDGYERGIPNRVSVAAFAKDPEYLTLYGRKDPRVVMDEIKATATANWNF
jgi:hypothetical protein